MAPPSRTSVHVAGLARRCAPACVLCICPTTLLLDAPGLCSVRAVTGRRTWCWPDLGDCCRAGRAGMHPGPVAGSSLLERARSPAASCDRRSCERPSISPLSQPTAAPRRTPVARTKRISGQRRATRCLCQCGWGTLSNAADGRQAPRSGAGRLAAAWLTSLASLAVPIVLVFPISNDQPAQPGCRWQAAAATAAWQSVKKGLGHRVRPRMSAVESPRRSAGQKYQKFSVYRACRRPAPTWLSRAMDTCASG